MNNNKINDMVEQLNKLSYEERKEVFSNFEKPSEKIVGDGDDDLYCAGENITNKEMHQFIADYNSHGSWMEPTLTVGELVKMYKGDK